MLRYKLYLSLEANGIAQIHVLCHLWKRSGNLHCVSLRSVIRLSKAELTLPVNMTLQKSSLLFLFFLKGEKKPTNKKVHYKFNLILCFQIVLSSQWKNV